MIRRRKHESFNRMMNRFDRQDHRFGNVTEVMRTSRRYHLGPRKKRQLKSEEARKRAKAMRRRNRRNRRRNKARYARYVK